MTEGFNRRIRSLHLADSGGALHGGAEIVFDLTVKAAEDLGHEVHQLVAEPKRTPLSYIYSRDNQNRVADVLRRVEPDIIHIHNYYHYFSPSVLAAIRDYKKSFGGVRVIFTAHDYHLVYPNSGFQYFVNGRLVNANPERPRVSIFHRYDHRSWGHSLLKLTQHVFAYKLRKLDRVFDVVIAPSKVLSEVFTQAQVPAPIRVVNNPIAVERSAANVGHGLVFLGRLNAEKGLVPFIEALERQEYECALDIFGDGPEHSRLIALSNHCEFVTITAHGGLPHGLISEVIPRYRALVYPSQWIENAPLAILEAARLGLNVVVPNRQGAEEMANLANSQFVYTEGDDASLVAAVEQALSCNKMNDLKEPEQFSYPHYVEELGRIYRGG